MNKSDLPDRFMDKVSPEPNSGCWLWMGSCATNGYGRFWDGKRVMAAHRFAYEKTHGSVDQKLDLDHLCRVRCCVNPAHLEPVTRSENCNRGDTGLISGIRNRAKTHCPRGHPYNETNTYIRKNGARNCRECQNIRLRKWRSKPL